MSINLKKEFYNSLKQKYESEIQYNKTTILIYFNQSVGIGEHPQHLEEIDKLLENIANAEDKLNSLEKYFKEYSDNISE
tara:strand:- start:719 stop:955 length:237 start_codon:yes stop_codon:yes gene_type:complete